jgi:hypothetical protein
MEVHSKRWMKCDPDKAGSFFSKVAFGSAAASRPRCPKSGCGAFNRWQGIPRTANRNDCETASSTPKNRLARRSFPQAPRIQPNFRAVADQNPQSSDTIEGHSAR